MRGELDPGLGLDLESALKNLASNSGLNDDAASIPTDDDLGIENYFFLLL